MAKGERYKNPSHSRHKQDRARCQLACGALMLHRRASHNFTSVLGTAYRLIQRGTDAACPQCR
jgi:hypothetical protein